MVAEAMSMQLICKGQLSDTDVQQLYFPSFIRMALLKIGQATLADVRQRLAAAGLCPPRTLPN